MRQIPLTRRKCLIIIILVSLILRLGIFLLTAPWDDGVWKRMSITKDQGHHYELAIRIMTLGTLSSSDEPKPNSYRTPGYALFTAGVFSIAGIRPWVVMLFQCFLDTGTAVLIFLTVGLIFSQPVALITALLYALDPFPAIYTVMMMSESLSLFFISLGLWAMLKYFAGAGNRQSIYYLVLSAVVFALSHLVRPILPLLPFIAGAVMFLSRKQFKEAWYKSALIFAFAFWLTLGPWYVRNLIQFNRFSISSGAEFALLILRVKPMMSEKWNKDIKLTQEILVNMADSAARADGKSLSTLDGFENGVYFRKIAMHYINENPGLFFKSCVMGTLRCFLVLPVKAMEFQLKDTKEVIPADLNYAAKGVFHEISNYFQKQSGGFLLLAIYSIILYACCYLLVAFGTWSILRGNLNAGLVFCLITAVLLAVLTAFGTDGRFRFPVMIFYFPVLAEGINFFVNRFTAPVTKPKAQTK